MVFSNEYPCTRPPRLALGNLVIVKARIRNDAARRIYTSKHIAQNGLIDRAGVATPALYVTLALFAPLVYAIHNGFIVGSEINSMFNQRWLQHHLAW